MSTPAQQPQLAGMPSAPVQPPVQALLDAGQPLRIAVQGLAQADAVVRDTTRGFVVVEVLLLQHIEHHPQATPLLATWLVPDMGSYALTHERARAAANQIKRGTHVIALGRGLETGRYHGEPVLRVLDTQGFSTVHPIGDPYAH
jgi:hypothetical protein